MQVGVSNVYPYGTTPASQVVIANGYPQVPPPGQVVVVQTAPAGWNGNPLQPAACANPQFQQDQYLEYRKWRNLVTAAIGTLF